MTKRERCIVANGITQNIKRNVVVLLLNRLNRKMVPHYDIYTVSHKKGASNFSRLLYRILTDFQNSCIAEKRRKFCTKPYLCCHTIWGNSTVQISLKLHKWTLQIVWYWHKVTNDTFIVTLLNDKHLNKCHSICSKCPPFAHTQAWRRPRHSSIALSMMVWSMPSHKCTKPCLSSSMLCNVHQTSSALYK